VGRRRVYFLGRAGVFGPKSGRGLLFIYFYFHFLSYFLLFSDSKLNLKSCLNFEFTIFSRLILLLLVIYLFIIYSSSHYLILAIVNDFNTISFLSVVPQHSCLPLARVSARAPARCHCGALTLRPSGFMCARVCRRAVEPVLPCS
jgi:hypothetical protein